MYRHSAALNLGPKNHAFLLPSPAHEDYSASESESETIAELDRKRRQLDEEIVQFKTQKEKEFHDFEQDLRKKRKRKRSPANGDNRSHTARTPPTDSSVLSLLGSGSRPQANGHPLKQNQQHASGPKPSRPTLSVEKLTIAGTNAPPAAAEDPPSVLSRSLTATATSHSTHNEKAPIQSPAAKTHDNSQPEPPPTPIARDHNDPFAGVFTPSYLPLLDSRSSITNSTTKIQQPALQSSADPSPQTPQAGSEASSLPSSPISPRIPSPAKRSYTAPILPSTSLPSALRVASTDSSSTKKRKHVTFRLADSAVVEPSSSYEEISSPDIPVESSVSQGRASANSTIKANGAGNGLDNVLSSEDIPWSWSKGPTSPIVEKGNVMNLGGDGEDEDNDADDDIPLIMRSINGSTHNNIPSPAPVAGVGFSFDEAPDGGSGVGFFELEEELHSPAMSPRRSPRSDRNRFGFFDDWGAVPDEDVDMEVDQGGKLSNANPTGAETETTEEQIATEMEVGDADEDRENETGAGTARTGLGIAAAPRRGNGEGSSTFASGSVPIDIVVRPSSSWVGSLGAGSAGRQSSFVP
jgi:hypothetical protein